MCPGKMVGRREIEPRGLRIESPETAPWSFLIKANRYSRFALRRNALLKAFDSSFNLLQQAMHVSTMMIDKFSAHVTSTWRGSEKHSPDSTKNSRSHFLGAAAVNVVGDAIFKWLYTCLALRAFVVAYLFSTESGCLLRCERPNSSIILGRNRDHEINPLHGIFTEKNMAQTASALMSNCRFPALPSPASMFGAV